MAKAESSVAHLFWGTIAVVVSLSFLVGSSEVARPRVLVLVAPPRPFLLPSSIVLDSVSMRDASSDVFVMLSAVSCGFTDVSRGLSTGTPFKVKRGPTCADPRCFWLYGFPHGGGAVGAFCCYVLAPCLAYLLLSASRLHVRQ